MHEFDFPIKVAFRNYFNEEECWLVRADVLLNDEKNQSQIALICNQPLVYKTLFQESLEGETYRLSDASGFLKWAHQGWSQTTHFVFFVLNGMSQIVGALDIKSANPNNAEIGYWADSNYPGNMSNALITLLDQATALGFCKFTAFVLAENLPSSRVLLRAGFERNCNEDKKDFLQYEKSV